MISYYRKTLRSNKLQKLKSIKDGAWMHITNVKEQELELIAKWTGLDFADVDDVLDAYEMPRIERHEEAIVMFVRNPETSTSFLMETEVLMIVVTDKNMFTISNKKNRVIEEALNDKSMPATTQQSKFLGFVLFQVVRAFTREIRRVSDNSNKQKKNMENVDGDDILELTKHEDILNQYLSALVPMRNVFVTLLSGKYVKLYAEDDDLFEDLLNSINQSIDVCTVQLKSIRALRDSYQIIFTNDLNKTMKFLTSFTILLTIPTILSSIYGMNVPLPFGGDADAFLYLMGFAGVLVFLLLLWFRKKKWF